MLRGVLSGLTMGGVEQLVLRYLTEANIKCTPGAAFNSCASIAPAMAARLRHWGQPAEHLKVVGLRAPLGPRAHKQWRTLAAKGQQRYFTHHVVLLGDFVADPTGAQFGSTFPLVEKLDDFLAKWDEAYVLDWMGQGRQTYLGVKRVLKES